MFDETIYRLDKLCWNNHEYENTGKSLYYNKERRSGRNCVECKKEIRKKYYNYIPKNGKECIACKEIKPRGAFYYPPSKKRHDICITCRESMREQKFILRQQKIELKSQEVELEKIAKEQKLIEIAIEESNKEGLLIAAGFDITRFKLGKLCHYDHRFGDTEYSVRYRKNGGCVTCHKEKTKETLQKSDRHLNITRNSYMKKTYGLTLEEYQTMYNRQDGLCAICGLSETRKTKYGFIKLLHIDHDHKTGKIRALLCGNCNGGLGLFKDSIQYMENAINYIKQYQEIDNPHKID